jgi:hypothetical protein
MMSLSKAAAALAGAAIATAGAATGVDAQTATQGQTTAQTKATVANEVGNPIRAPEAVDPGQQVSVAVAGADEGGRLEIWGPVTQGNVGALVSSVPLSGGRALVTAPHVSASYQLRWVAANGATRAQRAFEVAASPVILTVPADVDAGATLTVNWRGPAKPGDTFQIVDLATNAVLQSTPVAGDPGAQNVSELAVPDHRGSVELRYVGVDGTVLRSVPFEVRRLGG